MNGARHTLLVEFETAAACAFAIARLREAGVGEIEAYIPHPDRAIERALAARRSPLPKVVFVAGFVGAFAGYFVLYFTSVVDYPIDVAGYPAHAVPAFIPIAFETAVLFAGISAFIGSLVLAGLPRLHHPLHAVPAFVRASVDHFFVSVSTGDMERARRLASEAGAVSVIELEGGEP